eukprot:5114505-Amphidinium_carterae.1
MTVSQTEDSAFLAKENVEISFRPPDVGSDEWKAWTAHVDSLLVEITKSIDSLDAVLLMPTGSTRKVVSEEELLAALPESKKVASERGLQFVVQAQQDDSIVRGAAVGALAELQTEQMLMALEPVLNGSTSLQALSDDQIRAIYNKLDQDGNGISLKEMREGLQMMGIERDAKSLYSDLQDMQTEEGNIMEEVFVSWWWDNVHRARTLTITSASAFQTIIHTDPPEGFGHLVVLMATFTFCRTCKRFEPKFYRLADTYPNVRFIKLVANGTVGAAQLADSLGVEQAPGFSIWRRGPGPEDGELLCKWQGINIDEFQANLKEAMESIAA